MDRQPFRTPPQWWPPKLSPGWVRFWRWRRRYVRERVQRVLHVDVHGLDHVQNAVSDGHGVLITPNHPGHADSYLLHVAIDRLGMPFYFMTAWQVFQRYGFLGRLLLQHHGCFSIDREGRDMRAFKQAVEILATRSNPLVIFPEGEVYHVNERVTPFREGAAAMAQAAARRGKRPVVCIPCALKYHYVEDPTAALLEVAARLEAAFFWRPRPDLSLPERIYRIAEGLLSLMEIERLGHSCHGSLPERTDQLADAVLQPLEARYGITDVSGTIPQRVKGVRQAAIQRMEDDSASEAEARASAGDLDEAFFALQLFSYPGDYVAEKPSLERIAETLDKLEEDVLGPRTATIRGARRGTVAFGAPIVVESARGQGGGRRAVELTHTLEAGVQALIDDIPPQERSFGDVAF